MSAVVRVDVGPRMSEASLFAGIIHLAGQVADDASADCACESWWSNAARRLAGTAGSAPLSTDAVAVAGQTAQVLSQVDALLVKAGSDKSRILMVQIYLKE